MDAVAVLFKPFEEEPLLEAIGRAIALPHEIDLTYKNGTRSARFGPPVDASRTGSKQYGWLLGRGERPRGRSHRSAH